MSENEKKNEGQSCCCCKCWGKIFITIALLTIGAVIGHVMTMRHHCCHMRGLCGDGMKACWDRGDREREGGFEHKFREGKEVYGEQKGWFGHKADSLSEPNKAGCPMMDKREGKSRKD
jgi:hypothetical protein